jgi:replication-associated recombination protein RarA
MTLPTLWKPKQPDEFIGSARAVVAVLNAKIKRIKQMKDGNVHSLFYGPPGIGKSSTANYLGLLLAGHPMAMEVTSGQGLSVNDVRDWHRQSVCRPLYGDWHVRIVDEIDKANDAAMVELLLFLDKHYPCTAFFGTTNRELEQIPEREQTRMQLYKFKRADESDVAALLFKQWNIEHGHAVKIATANRGNVRGACFDAESHLDRLALQVA